MTLVLILQDKFNKLVNVIAIVNAKNLDKYCIFYDIQVYANNIVLKVWAIINIKTIYNLIAPNLIKEYNIPRDNKILSLMAANRGKIYLYK